MVRKMRGLPAYGSPKPQQKPSFKQRYDEAERAARSSCNDWRD